MHRVAGDLVLPRRDASKVGRAKTPGRPRIGTIETNVPSSKFRKPHTGCLHSVLPDACTMSSPISLSDDPGDDALSDDASDGSLSDDSMDTEEFERRFTRVTSPEGDTDHTPATMEQLCALETELRVKRRRYDAFTIATYNRQTTRIEADRRKNLEVTT